MNNPRLDTWEKINIAEKTRAFAESVLTYKDEIDDFTDRLDAFVVPLLAAQDRASREDERRKIIEAIKSTKWSFLGEEREMPQETARFIEYITGYIASLPVEDPTPSHES